MSSGRKTKSVVLEDQRLKNFAYVVVYSPSGMMMVLSKMMKFATQNSHSVDGVVQTDEFCNIK